MLRSLIAALTALICVSASAAPESAVQRRCTPTEAAQTAPDAAGYCSGGYFVPGLITNSTYWQTQPIHTIGRALFYNPGVMEGVARGKGYDTSGVEGLVSLLSPSTAGWIITIKAPTLDRWIKVMDVDAAALPHYYPHLIFSDSPIELSYALAEQLGNIDWTNPITHDRYFNVEICLSLQPEVDCAGEAVSYREWFLSIVRFQ